MSCYNNNNVNKIPLPYVSTLCVRSEKLYLLINFNTELSVHENTRTCRIFFESILLQINLIVILSFSYLIFTFPAKAFKSVIYLFTAQHERC